MPYKDKQKAKEYFHQRYINSQELFKERNKKRHKAYRDDLKKEVINHYGGCCFCCSESILAFLSLDHINDDGAKQRKELGNCGRGHHFYLWLKRHNWPSDIQVSCHNCNFGRHINGGVCPHKSQEVQFSRC